MSLAGFAVLAVLAMVTLLARRAVASPTLGLLRALFPSWRFFDRAVASPRLLVRRVDGEIATAWTAIDGRSPGAARATPSWQRWAFAPADNLALAYHAAVAQLVAELGELELPDDDIAVADDTDDAPLAVETAPQVTGLVGYALVTRIARMHVAAGARFQWKIVVPGDPAPTDYLLSPVLT